MLAWVSRTKFSTGSIKMKFLVRLNICLAMSFRPAQSNRNTMWASVQFNSPVVSESLRPHESQHARPPCPSPTPRVYSNSCPSSQWCHPTISSSVIPFSSCPQPSQHQDLFQWVSSSHEVAKVLEFQLQHHSLQRNPRVDLLQNGLAGSPCSPRDSQEWVFSSTTVQKHQFFSTQPSSQSNSHIHTWPQEKP